MKNIFYLALLALILSCTRSNAGFRITGSIEGIETATVRLMVYNQQGFKVIDSTMLSKGKFTFKGRMADPDRFYIKVGEMPDYISFFGENSKIRISANQEKMKEFAVQGSSTEDQYRLFRQEYKDLYQAPMDTLESLVREAKEAGDTAEISRLTTKKETLSVLEKAYLMDFVNRKSESIVSVFVTVQYLLQRLSYEEMKPICDKFGMAIRSHWAAKYLFDRNSRLEKTAIGLPAPDFAMNDTAGVLHSLSSLRGEYVLLDFWNTKCSPCRASHRDLRRIYDTYRNSGFEIFAVSFDQKREDWIQSIQQDHINWLQVSALTGWQNEAANLYVVERNPYNLLIDPQGVIIAKDLDSKELSLKLSELLGKKE